MSEKAGLVPLRSKIVISKRGRGGRRYAPYAFTKGFGVKEEEGSCKIKVAPTVPPLDAAKSRLYYSASTPAGPLPKGMLSLGGFFVVYGVAP